MCSCVLVSLEIWSSPSITYDRKHSLRIHKAAVFLNGWFNSHDRNITGWKSRSPMLYIPLSLFERKIKVAREQEMNNRWPKEYKITWKIFPNFQIWFALDTWAFSASTRCRGPSSQVILNTSLTHRPQQVFVRCFSLFFIKNLQGWKFSIHFRIHSRTPHSKRSEGDSAG